MTPVQIEIERGDITQVRVDAVVNAANPKMLGGGGVDGAIHRAAGPKLLEACRRVPARDGIRCPFGEARITEAFELPARYVIHAVGPIYSSSPDPEGVLRSAYRSCMELARDHDLESIAFPAISTGAYGFPLEPAGRIAIDAVSGEWGSVCQVRFVIFTDMVLAAFLEARAFG